MITFKDFVNEGEFSGRALKAQKFIEMCQAVVDKYNTSPDETRDMLGDHPMTYDAMKKITTEAKK
jgi:hypothetical protein